MVAGGAKVCYAEDPGSARRQAHRLWPNEALPGELAQILPTPAHFEQAAGLVSEQQVAASTPCGPDPEEHIEMIQKYADAGFDELYIQQIGDHDDDGFFAFYSEQILPRFRA
ncbi:MAG: hypothetical protein NVSMB51_12670 [Solirubrobacteraceae bacterium]